jgi:hypothetical protein
MVCLMQFVVQAVIGKFFSVHTCHCFAEQFCWSLPYKDNFQVVSAETTMTRSTVSNWIPWYVDEPKYKVTCRLCGNSFTKENGRMLSHLRYIRKNGETDINVKLCKNMKLDLGHVF